MGLVAVIRREPFLSMDEWLSCIRRTPGLERPPSRTIVNPFTNLPQLYTPPEGDVYLVLEGDGVGAIEPGPDFGNDGTLDVYAPEPTVPESVRQMIIEIAKSMGATVVWF
jgi:hypothetical protein